MAFCLAFSAAASNLALASASCSASALALASSASFLASSNVLILAFAAANRSALCFASAFFVASSASSLSYLALASLSAFSLAALASSAAFYAAAFFLASSASASALTFSSLSSFSLLFCLQYSFTLCSRAELILVIFWSQKHLLGTPGSGSTSSKMAELQVCPSVLLALLTAQEFVVTETIELTSLPLVCPLACFCPNKILPLQRHSSPSPAQGFGM